MSAADPAAISSIEEAEDVFPRIGSDEVGKGDFFGPLVVAAVLLESRQPIAELGVSDSKKLSDSAIRKRTPLLQAAVRHSLVKILPPRYNELYGQMRNVNAILGWAHAQAIKNLVAQGPSPSLIVVDQFGLPSRLLRCLPGPELQSRVRFFTRGERDAAVACASMIARLCFLQEVERLSAEAGMRLPLGAGAPVDEAAQTLARRIGKPNLSRFAKVHFKNYSRVD